MSESPQESSLSFLSFAVIGTFVIVIALQVILARQNKNDDVSKSSTRRRQVQHVTTGQVLIGVSYVLPMNICIILLILGCLLIGMASRTSWYQETFQSLLRPNELNGNLPGAFYFLLGTVLVAYVFPIQIARHAVLCLSWADPMASLVGMSWQTTSINNHTSVGGSLACFGTATCLGLLCFNGNLVKSLVGGLACTVAEAVPIVNDNLMIPIVTATAVYCYSQYVE